MKRRLHHSLCDINMTNGAYGIQPGFVGVLMELGDESPRHTCGMHQN